MMTNKKGFTLIELLIVVVIIGILAAIAIPKFANTKDKAYVAAMKSDLRNLATYEEQYAADNNGAYFAGVAVSPASLQGWTLRDDKAHPASPPFTYVFPNVELAPGEDLTIWTKSGTDDKHNLFWDLGHAVWNNRGGDTAILSDPGGTEISRFSY